MEKKNENKSAADCGMVVKNTGSWYSVLTPEGVVECKIKGNFRLKEIRTTNPIAVGDRVVIERNKEGTAFIVTIEERKNYIIRKSSNLSKQAHILAANIDQAVLLVTINYPTTSTAFIDRFLATAEAYNIPTTLVFNKIDRYNADEVEYMDAITQLYESIGYPCRRISALKQEGIDVLRSLLGEKITLLSGHSGVGKSTLMNGLIPGAKLKTNDISEYHNKGMHTTTFSEMIALPFGGFLIDTPGIKGFGTIEMEKAEVSHYFPEIFRYGHDCRFSDCSHVNEPGCAVREAVEQSLISESRYRSYVSILDDESESKYREAF